MVAGSGMLSADSKSKDPACGIEIAKVAESFSGRVAVRPRPT